MRERPDLKTISDDTLLRGLFEVLRQTRHNEADLIAHIAEVDARRLYAREAAPSMFAYCTQTLHLSEPEAALRIRVARVSRRHPVVLTMLREGRVHLSGIALLAPLLTRENRAALLKRATHKSKRQIEEMIAELRPAPAAPALVRRLPKPGLPNGASNRDGAAAWGTEPRADGLAPLGSEGLPAATAPVSAVQIGTSGSEQRPDAVAPTNACCTGASGDELPQGALAVSGPVSCLPVVAGRSTVAPPTRTATVEPVGPARFRVRFDASSELRDKLERLQALMRSSVPDGDLAKIIDLAVTEKLERLEAKRFAKTKRPRTRVAQADTTPRSRYIPAAVRRLVETRDEGRCTYRDKHGRRCTKRHDLEFHHRKPFGLGGDHSPEGLALMCRTHNALLAEHDFGKEKMARYQRRASRDSQTAAVVEAGTGPGGFSLIQGSRLLRS